MTAAGLERKRSLWVEMASLLARLGKHRLDLAGLVGADTKPIIGEK